MNGPDIASELHSLLGRAEPVADDDSQATAAARLFVRRRPRANRQCLISQMEDGVDGAETHACAAAPAGPNEARAGREDAPRCAASRKTGLQLPPQPAARLVGVPALGCSKCRMAKRGCGKCRHDRWTALKVSMSMLSLALYSAERCTLSSLHFSASKNALRLGVAYICNWCSKCPITLSVTP